MSLSSIKQNAQSIAEAYEAYIKLSSSSKPDKRKIDGLKNYMIRLSERISKNLGEENVSK